MHQNAVTDERRELLRGSLQATVDALYRRRAGEIPPDRIDDYVRLDWLEWWGGSLRLTTTGQNVCRQVQLSPAGQRKSAERAKERLSAARIAQVVSDRLGMVPRIRLQLAGGESELRVALPLPQAVDERGRNWYLDGFECGTITDTPHQRVFVDVVDAARDQYDLE